MKGRSRKQKPRSYAWLLALLGNVLGTVVGSIISAVILKHLRL